MSTSPNEIANHTSLRRWPPANTTIFDLAGLPVDVSGDIWRLNSPARALTMNWKNVTVADGHVLDALRSFMANKIKTAAPQTAFNTFHRCLHLVHTRAFIEAAQNGQMIPYLAFSEARDALGEERGYQLHEGRMMYRWCRMQQFEQFCPEVEARANKLVIGGNSKGRAVRSRDPDEGPLSSHEVASIILALKAGRLSGTIPIEEQAAIVLCLATGSNAGQYASMREEDLLPMVVDGEVAGYILKVPRHKKGDEHRRAQFRRRKLNRFFGTVLQDLCNSNRATLHPSDNMSRPLFRIKRGGAGRGNIEPEWTYHITSYGFTQLLQRAIGRLTIKADAGGPLQVTTQRFRYSLASRMVNNGASKEAVADALDHSDTQNVPVYWEIHSDIVDHLDRAMALALAPRAQAFAGIIRSEDDAIRGNEKGSRRHLTDARSRRFEPIGNCGSFSFCNITAPYACYTCVKFQAWMDGPHEEVLSQLLAAREERAERKLDPKMVGIEDELIMGVVSVITRIEDMRLREAAAND